MKKSIKCDDDLAQMITTIKSRAIISSCDFEYDQLFDYLN